MTTGSTPNRNPGERHAATDPTEVGSTCVFVTVRYDRAEEDGRWRRIHQEDRCQALSVPPDRKYQRDEGGPGVARIAQLLRGVPNRQDRQRNAMAFFQGLMFNTVVQATDAHAKNHSLLLVGDRVVLAPLYDVITSAPYADGRTIRAAMQIGGEYACSRIGRAECLDAARVVGVDRNEAGEVIEGPLAGLVPAFEAARAELSSEALQDGAADRGLGRTPAGAAARAVVTRELLQSLGWARFGVRGVSGLPAGATTTRTPVR